MPIFSNVEEVDAWVVNVPSGFKLSRPGIAGSIAVDMAVAVAEGIVERSQDHQMGASEVWPENSDNPPFYYKSDKAAKYGTSKTNFRTCQMISMGSLTANISVIENGMTVEMNYGEGIPASSSLTGYLSKEDQEITDKEKAIAAHNNGRPFYEVDQDIADQKVMPVLAEAFGKYMQEKANG